MENCCDKKSDALTQIKKQQAKVLHIVLWINAAMFFAEFVSGWIARSTALLGDSMDMLGDASVYALTLYVIDRGAKAQAKASLAKGAVMLLLAFLVLAEAGHKVIHGSIVPLSQMMAVVGVIALIANSICFALLYRHKTDNLNMSSVWLCSRNDLIANVAVLAAAGIVAWSGTIWPDLLVGIGIAGLFIHSSTKVLRDSARELKRH